MSQAVDERTAFETFALLAPSADARARIEERVTSTLRVGGRLVEPRPSLALEWLELLRQRPVANTALLAAAAVALLVTTPLLALPFALLA